MGKFKQIDIEMQSREYNKVQLSEHCFFCGYMNPKEKGFEFKCQICHYKFISCQYCGKAQFYSVPGRTRARTSYYDLIDLRDNYGITVCSKHCLEVYSMAPIT
jgi:hypothetical protein